MIMERTWPRRPGIVALKFLRVTRRQQRLGRRYFLLLPPGGEGSTLDELGPGWNLEPRRRASEAKGDSGSQGQKGNFQKS